MLHSSTIPRSKYKTRKVALVLNPYEAEAVRLRSNIDALADQAAELERLYSATDERDSNAFRRGMAAAYGHMSRRLIVARYGVITTEEAAADE